MRVAQNNIDPTILSLPFTTVVSKDHGHDMTMTTTKASTAMMHSTRMKRCEGKWTCVRKLQATREEQLPSELRGLESSMVVRKRQERRSGRRLPNVLVALRILLRMVCDINEGREKTSRTRKMVSNGGPSY